VWEKGRDIEVEDWYGLLVPILEFIEGKEFPGRVLNADGKYPIVIEDGDVTLLCNRETLKVEEVLVGVNDFFAMFVKMQTGKITEAEYKEYVRVHREININVFDLLDELGSLKGMYEVVEE
jgi:isopentenyl diphosphate isomerase/L-lactate dehydrogenase-like FMN-dependent dehydrogenase